MASNPGQTARWNGKSLRVEVLFSRPGVASQVWIGHDGGGLLVDTGDGCLRDVLISEHELKRLSGLVYTHGHFDHVGGLHSLLGYLRMIGRTKPLPILGPADCAELWSIVGVFTQCYRGSIPFEIVRTELDDRRTLEIDGVTLEAFAVMHSGSISSGGVLPPIPALGYRITHNGETVAITGDTGNCDALPELVGGADLAILEATYERSEGVDPEALKRVHLSEELATQIGSLAKRYMLVHRLAGEPLGPFEPRHG